MPHVEDGNYRARPMGFVLKESKNGNPYVEGVFALVEQPGIELFWNGGLSEKGRDITFKALRLCGWRGDDLTAIGFNQDAEVAVVVEAEEYNNKMHSKVKWVNSLGGKRVESNLDAGRAKLFADRMRAAIVAFDQKNGGGGTTTDTNNDPIPF